GVAAHPPRAAAAARPDLGGPHPRRVAPAVPLRPLEADAPRLVDRAHHAQPLGPREGPQAAPQVDRPRRPGVVGVGVGRAHPRDDLQPLRVAAQVVDPPEQLVGGAGSHEVGRHVHGAIVAPRPGPPQPGPQRGARGPSSPGGPGATASRMPERTRTVATSSTHSLLTPRPMPAGRSSSASGYSSPLVVTPTAGPWAGSRLTSSPGRPASDASPATTHTCAGPIHASTVAAATKSGADTVSATAIVWSSRSPVPVTTTTRSTSAASAASSASSRSVASLAAGWRWSGTPAAPAAASAPGSTESMSPTTRSTRSPRASACWSPSSAATTTGRSPRSPSCSRVTAGGPPPATTTATRRAVTPRPPRGGGGGPRRPARRGPATRAGRCRRR